MESGEGGTGAAGLEAGDCRLARGHASGQFPLSQSGSFSRIADLLPHLESQAGRSESFVELGALAIALIAASRSVSQFGQSLGAPSFLLDCVSFSNAPSQRPPSAPDFGSLVLPLLAERRQENDPPVVREIERDPPRGAAEIDSKLEEPVAERTGGGEPQTTPVLGESFDGRHNRCEFSHGERFDPLLDFRLDLHRPHDITNDIKRSSGLSENRLLARGQPLDIRAGVEQKPGGRRFQGAPGRRPAPCRPQSPTVSFTIALPGDPAPPSASPRSGGTPSQRSANTKPPTIERRQNCHTLGFHRKVTGESGPEGRLSPGRRRTYVLLKRLAPEVLRRSERCAAISRWDVTAGSLRGDGTYASPAESSLSGEMAPDKPTNSTITLNATPSAARRVATLAIACASSSAGHAGR